MGFRGAPLEIPFIFFFSSHFAAPFIAAMASPPGLCGDPWPWGLVFLMRLTVSLPRGGLVRCFRVLGHGGIGRCGVVNVGGNSQEVSGRVIGERRLSSNISFGFWKVLRRGSLPPLSGQSPIRFFLGMRRRLLGTLPCSADGK